MGNKAIIIVKLWEPISGVNMSNSIKTGLKTFLQLVLYQDKMLNGIMGSPIDGMCFEPDKFSCFIAGIFFLIFKVSMIEYVQQIILRIRSNQFGHSNQAYMQFSTCLMFSIYS